MLVTPEEYYASSPKEDRFVRLVSGEFEREISVGQKKALRKLEGMGLAVELASVPVCFPIIEDNRSRKGRPYSMTLDNWLDLDCIPHTVYCFAVMPGILAAAMCVRVSPDTLYVQAWGDAQGQEKLSPVVLLCKGIYDWCSENGFSLLDIGIAGDNEGLADFKRRLGFRLHG